MVSRFHSFEYSVDCSCVSLTVCSVSSIGIDKVLGEHQTPEKVLVRLSDTGIKNENVDARSTVAAGSLVDVVQWK